MVGPFALYFGIKPWELRSDLMTHDEFLALEMLALRLISERGGDGGG